VRMSPNTHPRRRDRVELNCEKADQFRVERHPGAHDYEGAESDRVRNHGAKEACGFGAPGLADVRYASGNRLLVTRTPHVVPLGEHRFAEEASFFLGRRVRVYATEVLKNPGVGSDLLAAKPL
jgi:hypothetical protein